MEARRFLLAPKDVANTVLTVLVWCLPLGLLWAGWKQGLESLYLVLTLLAIYATVWFYWRPGSFLVSAQGLEVIFPLRRRFTAASDITGCRLVSREEFKSHFGRAARVGAGGLWGGFGLLWTQHQGWVEFYVSRCDDFLLIERQNQKPLLISPERPEEMLAALESSFSK